MCDALKAQSSPSPCKSRCLARRVGKMIVAADDMRHAHVVIIDDHGMHVGRVAVRTQNDEIIQVLVREAHFALDLIVHDSFTLARRLDADDRLDAFGCLTRVPVTPTAVIARRTAFFVASSRIAVSSSGEQ